MTPDAIEAACRVAYAAICAREPWETVSKHHQQTIRRQVTSLAVHWGVSEQADMFGGASRAESAWEEGHRKPWRRGPDDCLCGAYGSSECGCGKYGTGPLLSLSDNPYRRADR